MGREVEIAGHNPSPGGRGKPRLFIKKMVLENFKSYAGKQYIGPFHKVRAVLISSLSYRIAMYVRELVSWCQ